MEINELLLHLIKKIESGEVNAYLKYDEKDINKIGIFIGSENEKNRIEVGCVLVNKDNLMGEVKLKGVDYQKEWNNDFKERFYKEKGLDKCWIKECLNKIYQTKGDYKKVKVKCQVCNECGIKYQEK